MKKILHFAVAALFTLCGLVIPNVTSAQDQRAQKEAALPRCDRPMGTVAIVEPKENWWSQRQLQSPEALIKMYVLNSGCFTVVDIAKQERALAASGNLQQGSNIGGGQIKAADYVITPDVVTAVNNTNGNGNPVGALVQNVVGGVFGALAATITNVRLNDSLAEVTLAVTDVRTSVQWSTSGKATTRTDMSFGTGGGLFMGGGFGAAGAGSYENTPTGQTAALAYLEAYIQVVERIRAAHQMVQPGATPPADTAQPLPPPPQESITTSTPPSSVVNRVKPVTTARNGTLYSGPSARSQKVREVPPGTILYPTGNVFGPWWEVEDDSGQMGWVPKGIF